ncbi:MAG: Beta-lactamase TEM-12 [Xylophilus sp.]|nr:MAG: Beta-lactamase TEM-12 [Xylophilus sp.]
MYVKDLASGEAVDYHASEKWYLSSTAKVAVAIAVLRAVDAGRFKLGDQLVLEQTDKVDGSGQLVWSKVGTRRTIDQLIDQMLWLSDNTGANMPIRAVGIDELNATAQQAMGRDFGRLTDFTEVRRAVYDEFSPKTRQLTNQQLVEIAGAPMGPRRVDALRRAAGLAAKDLQARTMDEAYDRYYAKGANTTTLVAYGGMLEKVVRGELLSPGSTQRLFTGIKIGKVADYRLEGGLPRGVQRIHKTGTQYRRACHMMVVNPQDKGARGVVIATCAADMDDQKDPDVIFRRVGLAVSETLLKPGSVGRQK